MQRYKLDGVDPVPVEDPFEWARWKAGATDRGLRHSQVGEVHVGTTFTGVPAGTDGQGKPLLWETTILWPGDEPELFDLELAGRASSVWSALMTHADAIELVERHLGIRD